MAHWWEGGDSVPGDGGFVLEVGNSRDGFQPGVKYFYSVTITNSGPLPGSPETYAALVWPTSVPSNGAPGSFFTGLEFAVGDADPLPPDIGGSYNIVQWKNPTAGSTATISGWFIAHATTTDPLEVFYFGGSAAASPHDDPSAVMSYSYWIDPDGWAPPDPPPGPPEVGILDPDLVALDTLDDVEEWTVRVELKDVGSGSFKINRYSTSATDAILKQGNWCQVIIPRISAEPIAIWQLESGSTILLDAQAEEGGESVTWAGRGGLSYLERAKWWEESYVLPDTVPGGVSLIYTAATGRKPGQLLRRIIAEFQHASRPQQPIPLVTVDFDYSVDSDGNAWVDTDATSEMVAYRGDSGLQMIAKLIGTGEIDVIMDTGLGLHGYNSYGRDLTSATFADRKSVV